MGDKLCSRFLSLNTEKYSRAHRQATPLWGELSTLKVVVSEPRGAGDEFDAVMRTVYGAVASGRGALFLAVYRGKVCRV